MAIEKKDSYGDARQHSEATLAYYNKNAASFVESTQTVEFSEKQDKFLKLLPEHATILDFGCGSGRDSKAFLERGYHVDAIDGSDKLCRIASEYIGQPVKQMLFQDLNEHEKYDGIWACSSILHLNHQELHKVLVLIQNALKQGGYLYTSFKYGTFEGMRNGRYFIDQTENTFDDLICDMEELKVVDYAITSDVRPGREEERWLNIILEKKAIS